MLRFQATIVLRQDIMPTNSRNTTSPSKADQVATTALACLICGNKAPKP